MVKFKVSKKKDINGWRIGKIVRIGSKFKIWSKWECFDLKDNIIEHMGSIYDSTDLSRSFSLKI